MKIVTAKCVPWCLVGFLEFVYVTCYVSIDGKGLESAAEKTRQNVK